MKIQLNGLEVDVPEDLTVSGLIQWDNEGDPDLIVEVNGRYVFPKTYDRHRIRPGDRVEFINPNLGG